MRADSEIKRDVEDELRRAPDINATDIAVAVKSGVVALTGFVRSYGQKYQAEADTKRVAGVAGVANDIEVRLPAVNQRPDPDRTPRLPGAIPGRTKAWVAAAAGCLEPGAGAAATDH